MSKQAPGQFWHIFSYVLLGMCLAALVAVMGILLITFRTVEKISPTGVFSQFLGTMALVVGILLIFSVFCIALVIIHYFSQRMRRLQSRHGPTEYVDAWKLAGQRFKLPEEPAGDPDDTGDPPSPP